MTRKKAVDKRFWDKVDASGICWIWTAANQNGYGRFWDGQRVVQAHRWAWQYLVGPLTDDVEIDHLCRTTSCVNPDHLEPVPHHENVRRGVAGWNTASKTHCPNGHAYSGENLLISGGRRFCRTCARGRARQSYVPKPREEKTHCPQGHEFNEENTGRKATGFRYCRACDHARYQAHPRPKVTHCPKGHPYSGDNVRIEKSGYQRCRECERERSKRRAKAVGA